MIATHIGDHTRSRGLRAVPQPAGETDEVSEIGDLGRMVERDIQVLKANLAKQRCGHERDAAWDGAWTRLERAWGTVRSELLRDKISTWPAEGILTTSGPSAAAPLQGEQQSAFSAKSRLVDRVPGNARNLARQLGSAIVAHTRRAKFWAIATRRALVKGWERARPRLESAWNTSKMGLGDLMDASRNFTSASAARLSRQPWLEAGGRKRLRMLTQSKFTPVPSDPSGRLVHQGATTASESLRAREDTRGSSRSSLNRSSPETATRERLQSKLAGITEAAPVAHRANTPTLPVQGSSAPAAAGPFVLQPLPWLAGALAPVMSSRTIQMHHGGHHAACIALANQLSRERDEVSHKSALDIVCWARQHARDTELFTATSEAWNHALFWQSLAPAKKRPAGELCRAIDRAFGDFANFAQQFALSGVEQVGSGWLWLIVNRRKQVKILTTTGTDCPEYRGTTCLLAIDLWEHAYYFDHQGRRREYLDAVIDRRLDWDFAAARYRLALERCASVRRAPRRQLPQRHVRDRGRVSEPAPSQRALHQDTSSTVPNLSLRAQKYGLQMHPSPSTRTIEHC